MERKIKLVEEINNDEKKFIGRSEAIRKVKKAIVKLSKASIKIKSILISGENGTGKELIASEIYRNGPWSKGPFIAVNCAALPNELIESEFFGHVKGAFTGANANKDGKFLLANHGVIFLDEIGDMSLAAQTKLLRVLEERKICPVGGGKDISIDVLVLAATNQNLEKMVLEKKFRVDLFYRLNSFNIEIPALRNRKSDILPLANYFLKNATFLNSENVYTFTEQAEKVLKKYDYPGNVRELRNIVEKAIVLCEGNIIGIDDLCLDNNFNLQQNKNNFHFQNIFTKAFSENATEDDRTTFIKCLSSSELNSFQKILFNKEKGNVWKKTLLLYLLPCFQWSQARLGEYLGFPNRCRLSRYLENLKISTPNRKRN